MSWRDLFPTRWLPPPREVKQEEQIVVNWLEREVDQQKVRRLPLLEVLAGWRNREVYDYVKSIDWTARMFLSR